MSATVDIGALRHRVAFEASLPASFDAEGGRSDGTVKRIDTWASIELGNAQANEETGQRVSLVTLDVLIRYRSDLTRDYRLIWRGNRYRIDTIEPLDTRCQWLRLTCRADL